MFALPLTAIFKSSLYDGARLRPGAGRQIDIGRSHCQGRRCLPRVSMLYDWRAVCAACSLYRYDLHIVRQHRKLDSEPDIDELCQV